MNSNACTGQVLHGSLRVTHNPNIITASVPDERERERERENRPHGDSEAPCGRSPTQVCLEISMGFCVFSLSLALFSSLLSARDALIVPDDFFFIIIAVSHH